MMKHIVMWKFKDEAEGARKEENLRVAKSMLDALPPLIPAISKFEVGIDVLHTSTSYDLVLDSVFTDEANLFAYQAHPEHVKVVQFLRKVQIAKVVVDSLTE